MSLSGVASGLADAFVAGRANQSPMNESAFLDLYARTAGPLGGYLRRLTGNRALAEDLVQEAYLRFLSMARVPEQEDHQRHYLFRIATNLARDHFRHQRRALAAGAMQPRGGHVGREPHDASDVWSLLGQLSPRDRELLLLAYVEGLTHQEIAQVTGLMRASIKPLLFRARRRFARALQVSGVVSAAAPEAAS